MPDSGCVVVVGGTSGLGYEGARHYVERGREVVITGREPEHAAKVGAELPGSARGLGVDLTQPERIAGAFADVAPVEHLVLAAISRDENTAGGYDLVSSR